MDKKITAQEAAKAVLKKAEEMLKSSELAKANRSEEEFGANRDQKEVRRKIMNPGHPNRDNEIKDGGRENVNHPTDKKGVSHVGEAVRRGATKYAKSMVQEKINTSKFQTKIGKNPDLAKEEDVTPADGVQKETIGQHDPAQGKENMNAPWGTEPGCHKLSKFMGRKEEKAKAKSAQKQAAPVEKTEDVQVENKGIGKEIESAKPTPKPPAPKNPKHPQKAD